MRKIYLSELIASLKRHLKYRIKFEGVYAEGDALEVRHMNFDIFDQNKIDNVIANLQKIK